MTGPSVTIAHHTRQYGHDNKTEAKHSGGIAHHTRQLGQACRQATARIRHCLTSSVSPLGWAATGCGTACLCAFPLLGWIELLTFGIASTTMMLCAILLALGNTKFDASIHVSRHRITVDGTISITVNISNSGTAPTTNTQGGLPIGNDRHRFSIPRSFMPQPGRYCLLDHCIFAKAIHSVLPAMKTIWQNASTCISIRKSCGCPYCTPVFLAISKVNLPDESQTMILISMACANTSPATIYATSIGQAPPKQIP